MIPMRIFSNKTLLLLALLSFSQVYGQLTTKDSTRTVQLWGLSAGVYQPGFDMATNYSAFASAEVEYLVKNKEGVFQGLAFKALYGNVVKNPAAIFSNLTDDDGNFLGVNGEFATIQAGLSGGQLMYQYGKLLQSKYNPNSGWVLIQGVGLGQHKIGLRDQRGTLPQLQSPFLEGYDRLHLGLYSSTSLRYLHLDNNERVNWSANIHINLGASQNIRGFNVDLAQSDTSVKFDAFIGGSLTWFIPVYAKQESFYLVD